MSGRVSAGILLYRLRGGALEVLIAHPGGPYAASKDLGAWSVPKGEVEADEGLEAVALREFAEETGHDLGAPSLLPLGTTRQKGGKLVHAWACEGDLDPGRAVSNTFTLEWPPGSERLVDFPEIDRVAWFDAGEARLHLKEAQGVFVDRLEEALGERVPGARDPDERAPGERVPGGRAVVEPTPVPILDPDPVPADGRASAKVSDGG